MEGCKTQTWLYNCQYENNFQETATFMGKMILQEGTI